MSAKLTALIVGASRGLGLELTKSLHSRGYQVYATVRSPTKAGTFPEGINVIEGVDVGKENAWPVGKSWRKDKRPSKHRQVFIVTINNKGLETS